MALRMNKRMWPQAQGHTCVYSASTCRMNAYTGVPHSHVVKHILLISACLLLGVRLCENGALQWVWKQWTRTLTAYM